MVKEVRRNIFLDVLSYVHGIAITTSYYKGSQLTAIVLGLNYTLKIHCVRF